MILWFFSWLKMTFKEKLNLYTSIDVTKILQLDEVHSLLSLQLKLTIEWTDTRHEYIDLKTNKNMNSLSSNEMDEIWMPTIVFDNTNNRQQAAISYL